VPPKRSNAYRFSIVCLATLLYLNCMAQPVANFTANITSGCSPLVVQFQDLSIGNPTFRRWDLGNGTISNQINPIGTYFNPGIYTVSLIVKNSSGSDTMTKVGYIVVNDAPTINFSANTTSGCFPLKVTFTDLTVPNSGTSVEWTWDFGDGTFSNLQNPEHTYVVAGSFTVTLKVKNSKGCFTIFNKPNYITTVGGVLSNFTVNPFNVCTLPTQVNFTNTSTGTGALSYIWNFGDGGTSTQTNPTHLYTSVGAYTVGLIVQNNNGCRDTVVKNGIVHISAVSANFSSSGSCTGSSVNFTNTSTPSPVAVVWDFGDGTTSSLLNPIKIYNTPGSYFVKMVANFVTCSDSITKQITINPKPIAAFTNTPTEACNAPLNVQFNNNSVGATAYQWFFGDGGTTQQVNPSNNYLQQGNYTATLIATNTFGCTDTLKKIGAVKILPPKILSFTGGTPYSGCAPYTSNFSAVVSSPEPLVKFEWNFNDGTPIVLGSNPVHTFLLPGVYAITLIVTTVNGCTDTLTVPNAVILSTKPTALFTATPLDSCALQPIMFSDNSLGTINGWFWSFGDGGTSSLQNPVHNYSDTGYFSVMLIVSNLACKDTLTLNNYIHIKPPIARFSISFNCDTPYQRRFIDQSIGAVTHFWTFGDGSTSTAVNPVHVYPTSGIYPVSLTVTNGICSYLTNDTLIVVSANADFSVNGTAFCKYADAVFTVNNINTAHIANYKWSFGDGFVQSGVNLSPVAHQYTASGIVTPSVIITDILGCTDTLTQVLPITVYGPKAGFSNLSGTCINEVINFTDSSVTDGVHAIQQWIWTYGDGRSDTLQSGVTSHQYTNTGTFDVMLKVTDAFGCYDTLFKPAIVLITKPIANFISSDTLHCADKPVSFTNQSQGINLSYVWSFGDNTNSTTQNPQHSYVSQGLYSVNIKVTDLFGCTDSLNRLSYIRIANSVAKFNFLQGDSIGLCYPFLITVANQSLNTQSVSWNFGDGGFSNLDTPSHFYNYVGIYPLQLKTTGFGGCIDSVTQNILVKGPTGTFTYSPKTFCKPDTVRFVATTLNNATFLWDFSDGVTIATSDSVVKHLYSVSGLFRPKMILIDTSGCQVPITGIDTIEVIDVATKIKVPATQFCDSVRLNFFDSTVVTNDNVNSYVWNFGDNTTSSSINPTHFYFQPGNYTVSLKVTTAFGCSAVDTLNIPINVVQTPVIKITGDSVSCLNTLLTYQGFVIKSDSTSISWNWNLANGNISTLQNPPPQFYSTAGIYTITAISSNASGCSDTATKNIIIHPKPNTDAGVDSVVCKGNTITLQPSGANSYVWRTDATLSCSTCTNPIAMPDSLRLYSVTGFNSFGCSATDSLYINVIQPFNIRVSATDTLCTGESAQLVASGAHSYTWSPTAGLSNSAIPNPVATPTTTTIYMVLGTDRKNCFIDTGKITIKVYPIPQFNIVESLIKTNVGSNVRLITTSSADITKWNWIPNKWLSCSSCPSPIATITNDIKYIAEVSNPGGCTARDEVTVETLCNGFNVFIPNTFSPNGDGMNDVFYPRGKGLFKVRSMKIFNRWGETIFSKTEFTANDASAGWNGTFNSKQLSSDVYVYTIEVVCDNNTTIPLKGNVTLLR
jgi:gliding motility-associated-like protein